MKKILCTILVSLTLGLLFAQNDEMKIRVGVLSGPSSVPAAWLMENSKTSEFTKYADPQALLPKLVKKEIDVGFLPVNVAAKIYNSTHGAIICSGITGNGNLSVVSTENMKRISDLRNKTVYIAGQGATPEYMFKYILEQNRINADKDISLKYSIPTAQLAANLISGKIAYCVMPEPFITIAISKSNKKINILSLQDEYKAFSDTNDNYPLTVMVVRKEFAEEYGQLLDVFLQEYKKASEWTLRNPKASGQLVEKLDLGLSAAVVTKSIPKSEYVFIEANDGKEKIESLLNIFLKYSPEAIGGNLPDKDFYYAKKNPQL